MFIDISSAEESFVYSVKENKDSIDAVTSTKPKIYEVSQMNTGDVENIIVSIRHAYNNSALVQSIELKNIQVDGTSYDTFEELSSILTPILFKKGGSTGNSGGAQGITGNGGSGQIMFWSGTTTASGNANIMYDSGSNTVSLKGSVRLTGGLSTGYKQVTENYTVLGTDYTLHLVSEQPLVVTLPSVVNEVGRILEIVSECNGASIKAFGTELIGVTNTFGNLNAGKTIKITSTGTKWVIVALR